MPVFVGHVTDILWQIELTGAWADFEKMENQILERAWGNDEETVNMKHWPHHSFHLPLKSGGIKWMEGLGPFQINNKTGYWRRMRRVLDITQ
jgi:hypothetical protein